MTPRSCVALLMTLSLTHAHHSRNSVSFDVNESLLTYPFTFVIVSFHVRQRQAVRTSDNPQTLDDKKIFDNKVTNSDNPILPLAALYFRFARVTIWVGLTNCNANSNQAKVVTM